MNTTQTYKLYPIGTRVRGTRDYNRNQAGTVVAHDTALGEYANLVLWDEPYRVIGREGCSYDELDTAYDRMIREDEEIEEHIKMTQIAILNLDVTIDQHHDEHYRRTHR